MLARVPGTEPRILGCPGRSLALYRLSYSGSLAKTLVYSNSEIKRYFSLSRSCFLKMEIVKMNNTGFMFLYISLFCLIVLFNFYIFPDYF